MDAKQSDAPPQPTTTANNSSHVEKLSTRCSALSFRCVELWRNAPHNRTGRQYIFGKLEGRGGSQGGNECDDLTSADEKRGDVPSRQVGLAVVSGDARSTVF
ncbi:unnamed protein product [Calypogeia fissa]